MQLVRMIFLDESRELFFLVGRKFYEEDLLFLFHQFLLPYVVGFYVIDTIDAGGDSRPDESLDEIFELSPVIGEGGDGYEHGDRKR